MTELRIHLKDIYFQKPSQNLSSSSKVSEALLIHKSNALSLLAQYSDSSSGSEDDEVVGTEYRAPARKPSSSSSSSDSEEELDIKVIEKKIRETVESDGESGEENATKSKRREPLKVKGELSMDDLPPIQDLQITVDERECMEIGAVTTIVDQLGKSTNLELSSIVKFC